MSYTTISVQARRFTFTGAAIFLAGVLLRTYNLFKFDLWFDELVTYSYSAGRLIPAAFWYNPIPWSFLAHKVKISFPLTQYYSLISVWGLLAGEGKLMRVPSWFFSILFLWLFYRYARLFLKKDAALYALAIAAVSPLYLWYAQEARQYAFFSVISLLPLYFLAKAFRTGKRPYWVLFTVSGVIGLYGNVFFGLLLVCTGFFFLDPLYRRYARPWSFSVSAIALSGVLLGLLFLYQFPYLKKSLIWIPPLSWRSIYYTQAVFNLGYSADLLSQAIGTVLFGGVAVYGCYCLYVKDHKQAMVLLSLYLVPFLSLMLFSVCVTPVFLARYLIIIVPFYYIFVGQGLASMKNRLLRGAVLVVMAVLFFLAIVRYYQGTVMLDGRGRNIYPGIHSRKEYGHLRSVLVKRVAREDAFYTTNIHASFIAYMYLRPWDPRSVQYDREDVNVILFFPRFLSGFEKRYMARNKLVKDFPGEEAVGPFVWNPQIYREPRMVSRAPAIAPAVLPAQKPGQRLWLLSAKWNQEPFSGNVVAVRAFIQQRYKKESEYREDGISLEEYILQE